MSGCRYNNSARRLHSGSLCDGQFDRRAARTAGRGGHRFSDCGIERGSRARRTSRDIDAHNFRDYAIPANVGGTKSTAHSAEPPTPMPEKPKPTTVTSGTAYANHRTIQRAVGGFRHPGRAASKGRVSRHRKTPIGCLGREELRKELGDVKLLGLNQLLAKQLYSQLQLAIQKRQNVPADFGPKAYVSLALQFPRHRNDLGVLPFRSASDCQLGKEEGDRLHVLSKQMRTCLQESVPRGDTRPDPAKVRQWLAAGRIRQPNGGGRRRCRRSCSCCSTKMNRCVVCSLSYCPRLMGRMPRSRSHQQAIFDLAPAVRVQAVKSLSDRPIEPAREVLLARLEYPWSRAADHAAEAIAALDDQGCLPALVELLRRADPTTPFTQSGGNKLYKRELIRMSHLCNCMVCHAPSQSTGDLVRGRVPIPDQEPPPLYYAETTGTFVGGCDFPQAGFFGGPTGIGCRQMAGTATVRLFSPCPPA